MRTHADDFENERTPVRTTLADLITEPVIAVGDMSLLSEVRSLLVEERVPAIAVVDIHGELCGVVTRTDVLRTLGRPDACVCDAISGVVSRVATYIPT